MSDYSIKQIGTIIRNNDESGMVVLDAQFAKGLHNLKGYGYIQILWWANKSDGPNDRETIIEVSPYMKGPEELGVFATRAPERPNPIGLSCSYVTSVNEHAGTISLAYVDADDGTPVIDIKPYVPSLDRVKYPVVPDWCKHWPDCVEASGDFNWSAEFSF